MDLPPRSRQCPAPPAAHPAGSAAAPARSPFRPDPSAGILPPSLCARAPIRIETGASNPDPWLDPVRTQGRRPCVLAPPTGQVSRPPAPAAQALPRKHLRRGPAPAWMRLRLAGPAGRMPPPIDLGRDDHADKITATDLPDRASPDLPSTRHTRPGPCLLPRQHRPEHRPHRPHRLGIQLQKYSLMLNFLEIPQQPLSPGVDDTCQQRQ